MERNPKDAGSQDGGQKNEEGVSLRAGIGPLLLLTGLFFLNFTARVVFAPLMPEIEAGLGISHGAAGSLFFLMSVGYFFTLLCSGWFAARLTHRRTIVLSSVVLGVALLATAFADRLWSIRITLLLLGAAAGLYLPSGIATLTGLIDPKHWGKAIAIHELAPNLGFAVAPLLVELALVWFSWRSIPVLLGLAAILIGALFGRYARGGEFAGTAPGTAAFRPFLVEPAFWMIVVLFSLAISSTLGIYTMLPLYLVNELSVDRSFANTLVAFSRVSGLFMALAGGWATDRYGPSRTMAVVLLLTGIATVVMSAAPRGFVMAAIFLQPMAAVCFFPAGFAVLSTIGAAGSRNIAISLAIPASFLIGGGAVPTMIGYLGDVASFALGIGFVGGLITLGAGLAVLLGTRLTDC